MKIVQMLASVLLSSGIGCLALAVPAQATTIPDGFVIIGVTRLRGDSGGIVGHNTSPNPLLEWPDESLFGPVLVEKALAELTLAQRQEVACDRVTFAEFATGP